MPLSEHIPRIDDRRYDDIVTEARTRIARYTPEWSPVWTDFNDSDPGITLVQVFAWLTEMLIFRLGKVPEQSYLKFLQLIGIELRPAGAARTEITFPVLDTAGVPFVIVPERTQVAAATAGGEPPLVFETERAAVALAAPLSSVQSYDGFAFADLSVENDAADRGFEPFGPLAGTDSALLLGFDASSGFPRLELDLAFWSAAESSAAASDCGLPQTPVHPSATVVWEYWSGSRWRELSLLKDETAALARTGHLLLETPAPGEMAAAVVGAVADERYWIRGRLATSTYERPPRLLAVRTNTIGAVQAETVREEVLGGSDGSPNQLFTLANTPVLDGTLSLEIDEGDGPQSWEPVTDFFASTPTDRHYALNRGSGEVRFGDGRNGAIPVANVNSPGSNIVAREYRFGGGKAGNVAAGKIASPLSSIDGIDENAITNLQAAHGGRDEETLAEAKLRAPGALKSRCRAVTAADFEHLALEVGNIRRAHALPLHHPGFPDIEVPGVVSVIVIPDSDQERPLPSDGTVRTVCEYLNQRRLLTVELHVLKPTYREVRISTELVADRQADLAEVKQGVERSLLDFFHPLEGGEDGLGWPFGGDIYYSRVYQRVFSVTGVARIRRLVIEVDGEPAEECQDISLADGVLVFSTRHDIQVSYDLET